MSKIEQWLKNECKFAQAEQIEPVERDYETQVAEAAGKLVREEDSNAAIVAKQRALEAQRSGDMFGLRFWEDVMKAVEHHEDQQDAVRMRENRYFN